MMLGDIHDIAEMRADCDVTPDGHNQPNDCMQIQILTETAKALLGRFA